MVTVSRILVLILTLFPAASLIFPSTAPPKSSAKKSPVKAPAAKGKSASGKTVAKAKPKPVPKKTTASRTRKRKPVARKQQQPEASRIREIQQALADRGYQAPVSGVWDAQSVEALKRFQDDQKIKNLSGAGKLDSLTLIALGLGPQTSQANAVPSQVEGRTP